MLRGQLFIRKENWEGKILARFGLLYAYKGVEEMTLFYVISYTTTREISAIWLA